MARYVAGEIMNDGFVNLLKHKRNSGGFPMFFQLLPLFQTVTTSDGNADFLEVMIKLLSKDSKCTSLSLQYFFYNSLKLMVLQISKLLDIS